MPGDLARIVAWRTGGSVRVGAEDRAAVGSGGVPVDLSAVSGPSFWASAEIEESPALIAATTEAVTRQIAPALAVVH